FRGGGAFWLRFGLGFVFMSAALVFLGCTVRAWLRLAGGDLNALVGIAGLVVGVGVGAAFLRGGYSVGRSRPLPRAAGLSGTVGAALLLALAVALALGAGADVLTVTPAGAASPGGKRAPLLLALLGGGAVGVLAQRSRICTTGGIRDLFLGLKLDKAVGILGLLAGALALNVAFGQFRLGFEGQPVAHTDALGNLAAMAVAGLAAVLMGGCPLRQLVMAGEGDADASGALLGMFAGAFFMHGTKLASSPKGLAPGALGMLAVFAVALVAVGFLRRERAPAAAPVPAPRP
ncbi:MAG TPA: YedE family putative selenium transporter, partial [Anaeromyxobacteraceae bacterium]|nr:YedE family putative selenium transporter [Anaeromyxobacteraceae bacterium]